MNKVHKASVIVDRLISERDKYAALSANPRYSGLSEFLKGIPGVDKLKELLGDVSQGIDNAPIESSVDIYEEFFHQIDRILVRAGQVERLMDDAIAHFNPSKDDH
jgi:hypothetical protein